MDKLSSAHVYLRLPQVIGSFVNGLFSTVIFHYFPSPNADNCHEFARKNFHKPSFF